MTLWSVMDGGAGTVGTASAGQRVVAWAGRAIAARRRGVTIARTALVHPEARISARSGVLVIGDRSEIAPGAVIQGDVTIGADSSVQSYAIVVGYGGGPITIGDGVRIAAHTMIIAANHVFDDPDTAIRLQGLRPAPIVIEDDVWVAEESPSRLA
jgi:carbonic anhydrase/acetyltransferase-like protein (isoleucine patch superfamily)